jgi:serine/threonine protein kinase
VPRPRPRRSCQVRPPAVAPHTAPCGRRRAVPHSAAPRRLIAPLGFAPRRRCCGMAAAPADAASFFTEYGEAGRYTILEVIGKGSYGVVCSAIDNTTGASHGDPRGDAASAHARPRACWAWPGERVAIKKINDVFEHVSVRHTPRAALRRVRPASAAGRGVRAPTQDATRILREVKLLRQLKHPDIVEIKHIMLPPHPREFRDIYVVFELMETDLHQVIKANDDLTQEHHQFFLYQMLRGLKYVHSGAPGAAMQCACARGARHHGKNPCAHSTPPPPPLPANVFHRDLKPKNILANSDCKLKICDFGLARPSFADVSRSPARQPGACARVAVAQRPCAAFADAHHRVLDGLRGDALVPRAGAVRLLLHKGTAVTAQQPDACVLTHVPARFAVHQDD